MSQQIRKQITYVAAGQTAKALILVYIPLSVFFILLGTLAIFLLGGTINPYAIFEAVLLNLILGCVILYLACHIYNWMAARFGGIEIHLDDVPEEKDE